MLEPARPSPWTRIKPLIGYVAMLAATVALFLVARVRGETLVAPIAVGSTVAAVQAHGGAFEVVLFALAVITVAARLLGRVFERLLHQPPVMGEIVAGLMLGPSVLGAVWPAAYAWVLPPESAPYLGVIAKLGVILFMFLVGLELDTRMLRGQGYAMLGIAHASIVAPFLLGTLLALALYPIYSSAEVSFTVFALFLCVSLSVTAFPVLARILTDRRVHKTPLGSTALACAAVGDVSAWILLAFVVSVAAAQMSGVAWTVAWVVLYALGMLLVVRPVAVQLARYQDTKIGPLSHTALAAVFAAVLISAAATEAIGIHALFGAFVLGTILPHEGRLAEQVRARLQDVVVVLFLPAFFAFTGMRTQIGLLDGARDWLVCGAIIAVATAGKFGGSFVAARLAGLGWRESSALGILMNTRGLMELIVLNVGLDMGVISPTMFAMLVLMALVTTFSTTPILALVVGERGFADAPAAARGETERVA